MAEQQASPDFSPQNEGAGSPTEGSNQQQAQGPPERRIRSCFTCRRRKVKCNKEKPCDNCSKMEIECIFPSTPSRTLPPSTELLESLHKLERMVQSMDARPRPLGDERQTERQNSTSSTERAQDAHLTLANTDPFVATMSPPEQSGRLIRDSAGERYVKASFWDAFWLEGENEISSSSDDELEEHAVESHILEYNLIFGSQPSSLDTSFFWPRGEYAQKLLCIFKANVDPLTKIVHLPSCEAQILMAMLRDPPVMDGLQALCAAIFYGAAVSLSPPQCEQLFDVDRATLCSQFRSGLEGVLSNCHIAAACNLQLLQAFVLYLIILKTQNPDLSWKLTGLAARLGQSLGLHREVDFGLSKFETELRRRLWWQIAILEAPSTDMHLSERPLLEMSSFDTMLPRNVNDGDLYPRMLDSPMELAGFTDMTFTMLRCQFTDILRTMADSRRLVGEVGKPYYSMTCSEKEAWVHPLQQQIQSRYVSSPPPEDPLQWVTFMLASILVLKLVLIVEIPVINFAPLTEDSQGRTFDAAVKILELTYSLRTDPRCQKWSWFFGSYNQWHAMVYTVYYLCCVPLTKNATRAWRAVEEMSVLRWRDIPFSTQGQAEQWKSILKMIDRAKKCRRRARRSSKQQHTQFNRPQGAPAELHPLLSQGQRHGQGPPATARASHHPGPAIRDPSQHGEGTGLPTSDFEGLFDMQFLTQWAADSFDDQGLLEQWHKLNDM